MMADRSTGIRPDPLGRMLLQLSTMLALLGGLTLFGLTIMTAVSIVGRVALAYPIPGDFELVEIGMAVTIFAFLPYTQITRGNVIVDIFTFNASRQTKATLDGIGNLIFTALAAILTWRVAEGLVEARQYGESSMLLRIPVWWGYVPAVLFLGFLTVVCAYTVWRCALVYRGLVPEEPQ